MTHVFLFCDHAPDFQTMNFPPHAYRHAAYFSPAPGSDLWNLGSQWLGRCAQTDRLLPQPTLPGISPATLLRLTHAPRRYGWHATLKAPFSLAEGTELSLLQASFANVAAAMGAPMVLDVEVAQIGDFLALVPVRRNQNLHALADACVRQLHAYAAPLTPSELARRRQGGLSERQERMLQLWSYPHVMEDFQFHLTLTGPLHGLSASERSELAAHARQWFAPLRSQGMLVDAVSWFVEPIAGGNFRYVERFALAQ